MKTYQLLVSGVLRIIISFIKGVIYTFLAIELFAVTSTVTAMAHLDKFFVMALSITPGVGLGNNGTFEMGIPEVMIFLGFWSWVVAIIAGIIRLAVKVNIFVSSRNLIRFTAGMHAILLAGGIITMGPEFIPAAVIFGVPAIIAVVFYTDLYRVEKEVSRYLNL